MSIPTVTFQVPATDEQASLILAGASADQLFSSQFILQAAMSAAHTKLGHCPSCGLPYAAEEQAPQQYQGYGSSPEIDDDDLPF